MTPEQRVRRAERMIAELARLGRRARTELRTEHREMHEKINILIDTQIATEEQIKRTDEQLQQTIKKTGEQIEALTAGQAKTDEALRRFIDSLSKNRNGNSEN